MSILIDKRFTDLPWWAATLVLSGSYPWKQYVNKLEAVRSNGIAFDTNLGIGATFPSLTQLTASGSATPKMYRLDAKNIPAGGFTIDNGTAPEGTTVFPDTYEFDGTDATLAAGRTEFYGDMPPIRSDDGCTITAAFTPGSGLNTTGIAQVTVNGGTNWTGVGSGFVVSPGQVFELRVITSDSARFICTFTVTAA